MVEVCPVCGTNFSHEATQKNNVSKEKVYYAKSKPDSVEISSKKEDVKIGTTRAIFGYLTQEQVDEINKTRKLPQNIKIARTPEGHFVLKPNWFNVTRGTHTIPEGYELRRNIAGFTEIVPIDEEGLMLRKKSAKVSPN